MQDAQLSYIFSVCACVHIVWLECFGSVLSFFFFATDLASALNTCIFTQSKQTGGVIVTDWLNVWKRVKIISTYQVLDEK